MSTTEASFSTKIVRGGIPPHSIDTELQVLTAMMRDENAASELFEFLRADDFYKPVHQKVFAASIKLYESGEPIDVATVAAELERRGELDFCGGRSALIDVAESVFTAANAEAHGRIVLEKSQLRQLIGAAKDITEKCTGDYKDIGDVLDDAESRIFAIAESRLGKAFTRISEILPKTFEDIEEYHRQGGGITGMPTGFHELDQLTAGFHDSDLIILAGRPSMGKSALALNIVENVAIEQKKACAFFSLEMSKESLVQRMLTGRAKINAHHLRTGRLRPSDFGKLSLALGPIEDAPIFIDDTPAMGVLELRAKARRLKSQVNLGLVVIDYMQMMSGASGSENRQQEIALISRSLKALAKELNIPVLALSQLSRQVEQRGGERRPQLSDLRESGAIEQDADLVMFVYRASQYDIEKDKTGQSMQNVAEIIIGKQRNGPTGTVRLTFLKDYARFENMSRDRSPGPPPEAVVETPF